MGAVTCDEESLILVASFPYAEWIWNTNVATVFITSFAGSSLATAASVAHSKINVKSTLCQLPMARVPCALLP